MLNVQTELIKLLTINPLNRIQLVEITGLSRTTIFDNLKQLQNRKILDCFNYTNKHRGRPITYWFVISKIDVDYYALILQINKLNNLHRKKMKKIKYKRNNKNFSKIKKVKVKKVKQTYIKKVKVIDTTKCKICNREISINLELIKLKDTNRYCLHCIKHNKEVFNLLKINSYWYNIITNVYGM
jgi:hypothetical protein